MQPLMKNGLKVLDSKILKPEKYFFHEICIK